MSRSAGEPSESSRSRDSRSGSGSVLSVLHHRSARPPRQDRGRALALPVGRLWNLPHATTSVPRSWRGPLPYLLAS